MESTERVQTFWVDFGEGFQPMIASKVMQKVQAGEISVESLIRILPDAPAKPLRNFLTELVWATQREHRASELDMKPNDHFRLAFDHAPIGMARSDLAGRITDINPAFEKLLGYSKSELIGRGVGDLSDEEDRKSELRMANKFLSGEITQFQVEKRFRKKDGSYVDTMMALSLVRDHSNTPQEAFAQILELTDFKQRVEAQKVLEKATSRASMARGLAHDYGNILNVIAGSVAIFETIDHPLVEKQLEKIDGAIKAATHLTRQLKELGKTIENAGQSVPLDDTLRASKTMLTAMLGDESELVFELSAPLAHISLSVGPFHQLINNLSGNAGQAMSEGGTLTVKTWIDDTGPQIECCLEFSDTGVGMDPEARERAFEAFFTTRSKEGGSGLGLALVHTIVSSSGGTISIKDNTPKGTTFSMRWPLEED